MKIFLVYPPCAELNLKGYPLGLGYLAASLGKHFDVRVFNYNGREFEQSIGSFLKTVKNDHPDVVGISFNSFNRWGAYRLIKQIKRIHRNIKVVLGGVHPSTMFGQVFQHFYENIDFIIQSEGETTLVKLCQALEKSADFTALSGLVYKTAEGRFKANPVTDIVKNIDDLAMPDYSYAADEIRKKEIAFLIASRGCPVNCSFCSTSSFWGQNVRMNSPERIGAEVENAVRMGAKRIFFHDDTFNLGIERTIKIAGVLKKLNIEYAIQCRVTPVNEEMIETLVNSGCRHITWGAESLSETILDQIHKKITREQVKKAFDICSGFTDKLTTSAFFCVGTPGESEITVAETTEYLNTFIRSTHGPGASMLYILPGTKIHADLVKNHKFDERIWVKNGSVYYYTQEHSMKVLNRWRKMINRSGIRIPYTASYFWDLVPQGSDQVKSFANNLVSKAAKKFKRALNLLLRRY
ncbi:MAG: radical SAM protein [Candidatus Omnitrophota bacterium]|jgi:radical SAM superfamily enzyme YgiQ (UPF0313 family)